MRAEHIEDGDLVVLDQRTTAEDGETVVALIDDGLATLKRLYRIPDGLRLQPANPDYAPLHCPHGTVEVVGVVVAGMSGLGSALDALSPRTPPAAVQAQLHELLAGPQPAMTAAGARRQPERCA